MIRRLGRRMTSPRSLFAQPRTGRDRNREPEVRERAAHAGAAEEVLADRDRDGQARVVREHLHGQQARIHPAQHRDALRRDAGRQPLVE